MLKKAPRFIKRTLLSITKQLKWERIFRIRVYLLCTWNHHNIVNQLCSVAQSWPTLYDSRTAAHQAFLSLTVSQTLPKFIHVHCSGDVIQPSHPLTPSSPSALDLSQQLTRFQYKKVKKKKKTNQPTNQPEKCSVKMLQMLWQFYFHLKERILSRDPG